MAVQAQYPSNVLFLNRSVEEGKSQIGNNHLSLVVVQPQQQQQPREVFGEESFLDPTQMLFNPGVRVNSRKRGREHTSATTTTSEARNPLMSIQSQPQLINLIQLHNNSLQQQHHQQTNVVSTGLQLAFGDQWHHHQQHTISHLYPHQSSLDDYLASHIKQQQHEIDHFLQVQGEQLRRTLEEKRNRHYHALIGAVEESTARRLKEKETEVEKAARRNTELEARASQLIAEARGWQIKACEHEVTAATLQSQLQQAMMNGGGMSPPERDGGGGEAEDAESAYVDPDRVVESTGRSSCKGCRKRFASVVLLPCRHLCLCIECDVVAQFCPLCRSIRSSSIEVFLC
ncbi:BOI-related E3 ubiquitin-protein ligase 1-like [Solanum dulcamara]|uniref:BOI-related E3 ubiquitin-protein ligase 1-like n=1 Tax=Solanum dulcamara TaxID=45834 RepID=UPI0024855AC7|nr:BOI-related E3 ubiquitin-protein ligase 1-like [Solanum dulcamara]